MLQMKDFHRAVIDLYDGMAQWRIWTALALFDIKGRYRRSKLGQFWITISMAITVCALGLVYSAIFKIELVVYLPLTAVSFIAWGLIASLVQECATVFIEAEGYVRSSPLPKSLFIFRVLARNSITFAHNLILVPIVMVIFGIAPTWAIFAFFPAFLLSLLNGLWIAMVLGTFCARFRDVPQIVASIVQLAFFVSPVMWGKSQLAAEHQAFIYWNPFAVFLELLRGPILGKTPDPYIWLIAIGITFTGFLIALPFFSRYRARISFYM